ncbi:MAG: hypothetical protein ABSC93_20130 [Bryobacteraceae bacterium]
MPHQDRRTPLGRKKAFEELAHGCVIGYGNRGRANLHRTLVHWLAGMLREITGKRRPRVFVYELYLAILNAGPV